MNLLVDALAGIVRRKAMNSIQGRRGERLECRLIFHGPPLELLEGVFDELSRNGGITATLADGQSPAVLPVLLQLPPGCLEGSDPRIGVSGRCSESHLLHIRNDPRDPSYLALVPPGQHNNMSISSTTEEFGIARASNTMHADFDDWWKDGFVQDLLALGLENAGLRQVEEAMQLVGKAAEAIDQMDPIQGSRKAAWRLLDRIFSIPQSASGLPPGKALALACGVPPMEDGSLSCKQQSGILARIAEEMGDGFKTGVERLASGADDQQDQALQGFLAHVRDRCDIPTAFERATAAFYLPSDNGMLAEPPSWWTVLTSECWSSLLLESSDDETTAGELSISCSNPLIPVTRSMPAIVKDKVELSIAAAESGTSGQITVTLAGGSFGKEGLAHVIEGPTTMEDIPGGAVQKSPLTYRVDSDQHKPATAKVISLATWAPGIVVTSRMATKLSPPRKPRKASAGADWESSLHLPGSGRYELLLLVAAGIAIVEAECVPDDAMETFENGRKVLPVQEIREGVYQLEIEADGKYQLDVQYQRSGRKGTETCRTFITCEEAREEGCRSEFERSIKRNRQHLERFDTKAVVQLDRNARSSSLQAWILDEQCVGISFRPIVLADDYGDAWVPPDWTAPSGPVLSKARFLHDPRPAPSRFVPPAGFVEARREIAARIRASTDDQLGLVESAPLGKWMVQDNEFRALVETYVDSYTSWLVADREIACWVDAIAVCAREAGNRTLARVPDAIILSPLHPLRLAWHCLAQQVLHESMEGENALPCPAASILDPDCVPDIIPMSLQSPNGARGIDHHDFIAVECNSDYWSVLWNGSRLGMLPARSQQAPFDSIFGLKVGGISSGFSPAQVARALEDVTELLSAKPVVSIVVSSAGGSTDACNEGLVAWCAGRFGNGEASPPRQGVGPRMMEVYDTRPDSLRPDQATIANLSEDTHNLVRWFEKQPSGTRPDLGIIAQLDSAQPETTEVGTRSPLGLGGLIRHRVRRQLHGAFLSESRQARPMSPSGNTFPDKVVNCIISLEGGSDGRMGMQFAPDVHAVSSMLVERNASLVAVSSSAIDPACFLGGWIPGTYLWDYDLPSYSQRAGDTSGYYLLSQVRDADRDALERVLKPLLGNTSLPASTLEDVLLEVARRGIPTVRGLSGDDTGATGDLGLFLAARLLQDQFRISSNQDSLLPVLSGTEHEATIALVIPVDPFRGYLADLARSLGSEKKDTPLSRPDLLVAGIHVGEAGVRIRLTPVEVKCRQGSILGSPDSKDALGQAKALSNLFHSMQRRSAKSAVWKLAYQHLLLSMVGFGLRVYSQHQLVSQQPKLWALYHERIAAGILEADPSWIEIDDAGRLVVVDGSPESGARDNDGDGLAETIVISVPDSALMLSDAAQAFYDRVRSKVGDWNLLPAAPAPQTSAATSGNTGLAEESESKEQYPPEVTLLRPADEASMHAQEVDPSCEKTPAAAEATHWTADPAPEVGSGPHPLPNGGGGIQLLVGNTVDGFQPRNLALNISDTRLNQLNIGVVGDLGTGKTQLLKSLIYQICKANEENRGVKPRFLIFDYKRDYSNKEFVAATGATVVKPRHLPLNLFDTAAMAETLTPWLDRFRFFADVLDKVYSGIGPVQRDKLKAAVRNAYEACTVAGAPPTIYDIHREYRDLLGGRSDSPMAIIDDLVDMEIFERDPSKTKTFDKFLDGVVVISLDAMGQDDRSKNMLVAIMLNMFYENMLKTPKREFIGSNPQLRVIDSYLLVDEADNIMRYEFDVLRKLLLQGREFGAGVILASQYLKHFKASMTDYREPLLTWFIHKVPSVAPAELSALGLTSDLSDLSERVKTLANHQCLYKSFDVAGEIIRGKPFYELVADTASVSPKP